MLLRPPRSTLFPTRRSSDLGIAAAREANTRSWQQMLLTKSSVSWSAGRASNSPWGTAWQSDIPVPQVVDRKSTRLNSSHGYISYAVFCLKKKTQQKQSADCS